MLVVCQALITDRCWSTLFWRPPFQFGFCLFPPPPVSFFAVLFCDRFLLCFYFRFICGTQLLTKTDCYAAGYPSSPSRRDVFFCFKWLGGGEIIFDNMDESYWGIWRVALWFGLAFKLSWIVPLNSLKRNTALVCRKSRFWVSVDVRALRPKNAYLPIHQ